MRKLLISAGIGLASGLITFFLSVAFLCFVLLIFGLAQHSRPDMTLTYKVAAPVAVLAAITGFTISLVRSIRAGLRSNRAQ
jgi:predicted permease